MKKKRKSSWNHNPFVLVENADHPQFYVVVPTDPIHREEWWKRWEEKGEPRCSGRMRTQADQFGLKAERCHGPQVTAWLFSGIGLPNMTRLLRTIRTGHLPDLYDGRIEFSVAAACSRCAGLFFSTRGVPAPEWLTP